MMDAWNDSAEILLRRAGLAQGWQLPSQGAEPRQ
jgi:hypothetical protein